MHIIRLHIHIYVHICQHALRARNRFPTPLRLGLPMFGTGFSHYHLHYTSLPLSTSAREREKKKENHPDRTTHPQAFVIRRGSCCRITHHPSLYNPPPRPPPRPPFRSRVRRYTTRCLRRLCHAHRRIVISRPVGVSIRRGFVAVRRARMRWGTMRRRSRKGRDHITSRRLVLTSSHPHRSRRPPPRSGARTYAPGICTRSPIQTWRFSILAHTDVSTPRTSSLDDMHAFHEQHHNHYWRCECRV
ncbi:hypothetical protein K439DRAFT_488754 [Ramaria rubella]|nr:hypothetical protein K439DRAFT_488754 [Ramaria rubella]